MTEENKEVETDEEVETTENTNNEEQEDTAYSQSEVDSQISKAVASALEKREAKMQKELESRIEKERNEAAEYAKLTAKEQEEADYKKRLEEIESRERAINDRELLNQIESDLKENELPVAFAQSLLTIQDNEKIKDAVGSIKEEFDNAVNEQVKTRLRQDTPSESTVEVESDPFAKLINKYKK